MSDVLTVGEDSFDIESSARLMEYAFGEFQKACEIYQHSLEDEDDIEE